MAILNDLLVKGDSKFIGNVSGNLLGTINSYDVQSNVPSNAVFTDTTDLTQMTGILPASKGGTGNSTLRSSANALINALDSATGTPVNADYIITQVTNGGTTNTNYVRRPISKLYDYILSKITSDTILDKINDTYLNTHPENTPLLIPFINNDIAYLLKCGGSIIVAYDGVVKSNLSNLDNLFDASPSYFYVQSSANDPTVNTAVFELTLHKTFNWVNNVYIDFGSVGWRAKSIKIEVMNSNYTNDDWTTKLDITENSKGGVKVRFGHTPVGASNSSGGFNKLKITLTNWVSAINKRISQIGVYNCASRGLRTTFIPKDGASDIIGTLSPSNTNTYDLGSTSKYWKNLYTTNINGVTVGSTPKFTDTTYSVMTGATSSTNGASGLVPQPTSGNQELFLKGNGSWSTVKNLESQLVTGDLNNITEVGNYYAGTNNFANKPTNVDSFNLSMIKINDSTFMQILIDQNCNMYNRLYKPQDSTIWTNWANTNPKTLFGNYIRRDVYKTLPNGESHTDPEVLFGTDYNDLVDPGVYTIRGQNSTSYPYPTTHAPNGNNNSNIFYVMVLKYTDRYLKQLAFSVSNTNSTEIYMRSMINNSWTNWTHINTIATNKDIAEYEEGTFTPVLYETGNSSNIFSYDTSNSYASYIKNGNLLQIQAKIKLQTSGINNKQLSLSGLPFIISQSSIFNVNIVHSTASNSNLYDIAIAYPNNTNSSVLNFKHIYHSSIGYIILPNEVGGSPDTTNSGIVSGDNLFTITDSNAIIYISGTTDLSLVTS